jgi:hypothetical protein
MSTERDNAIKSVPYQSKVVKLTPTVAEGFLKLQELPGERKIKQKQLQQMMEAMLANRFRWEQVTLMTCEYGGVTYRDNGQHTCKAVLLLKGKLNFTKEVRVLHYKCRTEEELRLLYADTDGGIKRNQREKKMALLAGSAGFEGIPQGTLNLVTEGYALYRWQDPKERRRNNNPDQITEEIKVGSSANALCSAVARFVVEHAQGHKWEFNF